MKRTVLLIFTFCLLGLACSSPRVEGGANYVETGVDADAWVRVPAGTFLMGQHDHEAVIERDYEIMVTDVTNAQYADFLNSAMAEGEVEIVSDRVVGFYPGDPFYGYDHEIEIRAGEWVFVPLDPPLLRLTLSDMGFQARPGYRNHPMTRVSWFGAWGYCHFYGWRLPTDAEWEKAARGTDNRPYPWGDEIEIGYANFLSSHDIYEERFERAGGTTPVGFYNGKTYAGYPTMDASSPYGLYDMAGNVWQWTGDVRKGVHYRSLRGGSHTNYAHFLRIWAPNNADPRHTSPDVGFRCARDG
jgi:formylglycine-generating enzyme required for sulfatase activity